MRDGRELKDKAVSNGQSIRVSEMDREKVGSEREPRSRSWKRRFAVAREFLARHKEVIDSG